MSDELKIFIGYDTRESVAYHVASQSIIENTKYSNISITPLRTEFLTRSGVYWRQKDDKSTNEFSYTRFLAPLLSGFVGMSVYMDCDVIVKGDIMDLLDKANNFHPVSVVKHDYVPKRQTKYFGAKQHVYPCKNWSSVMVFDNTACRFQLTPHNISNKSPQWLHQFQWVGDRGIGSLPKEWNWLVEEYEHNDDAKLLHYTNGIPAIDGFDKTDHSEDWWSVHDRMQRARK